MYGWWASDWNDCFFFFLSLLNPYCGIRVTLCIFLMRKKRAALRQSAKENHLWKIVDPQLMHSLICPPLYLPRCPKMFLWSVENYWIQVEILVLYMLRRRQYHADQVEYHLKVIWVIKYDIFFFFKLFFWINGYERGGQLFQPEKYHLHFAILEKKKKCCIQVHHKHIKKTLIITNAKIIPVIVFPQMKIHNNVLLKKKKNGPVKTTRWKNKFCRPNSKLCANGNIIFVLIAKQKLDNLAN